MPIVEHHTTAFASVNKLLLCAAIASCPAFAQAEDVGRVLSSMPVRQDVPVPRQVCSSEQPVMVQPANSGTGAFVGSVAGGAAGNAFGSGNGRGWLTLLGAVAGALLGDRAESRPSELQHVRHCTMQSVMESRVVGYDVRYEYAGRHYSVRMPQDPGVTIAVQVLPASAMPARAPGVEADVEKPPAQEPRPRIGGEDFSGY